VIAAKLRCLTTRLRKRTVIGALAAAATLVLLSGAAGSAQPAQPGGFTVHLREGWNNVPYFGPPADPAEALATIDGKYSAVWHWDELNQQYETYDATGESTGDLTTLAPGRCYWIVATEETDLDLPAPEAGSVPALVPGWNNFVYLGAEPAVADALAALAGHFSALFAWNADEQRFLLFSASGEQPSELTALSPYSCYWLRFT
jgi:hypothetical protein